MELPTLVHWFMGVLGLGAMGTLLWVPLAPALVWGARTISAQERGQLFRRTARVSLIAGIPLMFLTLILVERFDRAWMPWPNLMVVAIGTALGTFPFYAAPFATMLFELSHLAAAARGEPKRPVAIRVLSIFVILGINLLAGTYLLFFIGAVAGAYRHTN